MDTYFVEGSTTDIDICAPRIEIRLRSLPALGQSHGTNITQKVVAKRLFHHSNGWVIPYLENCVCFLLKLFCPSTNLLNSFIPKIYWLFDQNIVTAF